MTSLTINCPRCNLKIELTEALARPFVEAQRQKVEHDLHARSENLDLRERELQTQQHGLLEREANFNKAVVAKIEAERALIYRQAELEMKKRLEDERARILEDTAAEAARYWNTKLSEREELVAEKDAKLLLAQEAELELRKERQLLVEKTRELALEVERRLDDERLRIRAATQAEEESAYRMKLAEKDALIDGMRRQVEELRRRVDQGPSHIQGEVQEIELEVLLKSAFPHDGIDAVPAGRPGGDILHRVNASNGACCGAILWESKRTKTWAHEWLEKNRQDQRQAGAHLGVIVTAALPKGVDAFDLIEGVWVVALKFAVPLARALRQGIIEAMRAQVVAHDREGKKERVYSYVTGPEFRKRLSAIVEAYAALYQDLDAEKRALTRCWAKRRRHLDLLISQATAVYGDMQGLVGNSLVEIEGLGTAPCQLSEELLLFPTAPRSEGR